MIDDPLVTITAEDLRAVLLSRKLRKLPPTYPTSCPEFGQLTQAGRVWWIVECVHVAEIADRLGKPGDAAAWRHRAWVIVAAVAAAAARNGDTAGLRSVADALDGKHATPAKGMWTVAEERVVNVVLAFRREHGRWPSQTQAIIFAAGHGVKLPKSRVSAVFAKFPARLPTEREPG